MGLPGYSIRGRVYVHHMNPVSKNDILEHAELILDPNYLITVSLETHNLIHYGIENEVEFIYHERAPNDTIPWKEVK